MTDPSDVVVWEWFDEYHRWRPYSPSVSNYIQQNYDQPPTKMIDLGKADRSMNMYNIDFSSTCQIRMSTGVKRPIKQNIYPYSGSVGSGVVWKWEGDRPGTYQEYDFETSEILENEFNKAITTKQYTLDLQNMACLLPYIIDFQNMTQTRVHTHRVRAIKREKKALPYIKRKDCKNVTSITKSGGAKSVVPVPNGAVGGFPTYMPFGPGPGTNFGTQYGTQVMQYGPTGQSMGQFGAGGQVLPGLPAVPGSSYMPTTGTPVSPRVTRSSVKKAKDALKSKDTSDSTDTGTVAVPPGWHPPMALPGGIEDDKEKGPKSKTKRKKAKPVKKIKPNLPPMGSISNYGESERSFPGAKPKKAKVHGSHFNHVIKGYADVLQKIPKDDECCICMCELSEFSADNEQCNAVISLKCGHHFHKSCLAAMYESGTQDGSIQCPQCKTIFGVKYGNCPQGTMQYHRNGGPSLPGYPGCGLIQVTYNIPSGIQGKEHPNPGQRYVTQGFPRTGFLPDNEEGQKILRLLIKAWERRLTFTIATSVTTGLTNAVVWNEIHHKTEIQDHSGHGYPDPKYFDNVTLELASQGVIDSDDESSSEEEEKSSSSDEDEDL